MAGRLFDLPAEIRLICYEYVFSRKRVIRVGRDYLETGLLLVSKPIRDEIIQYMRGNLTFVFKNANDFAVLTRGPLAQDKRSGRQRRLPYSRPYISKVRILMDFTIHREDDRHPLSNSPLPALPPEHETAPIDSRDVMFFLGNKNIPWQHFFGTRFYEQYRLMAGVLARRAFDHNVEINSRLLFMRRNWDWIFSSWKQCGLLDVEQVTLELHNLEFWIGHMDIHNLYFRWRPVVDFFRLLMLAPPSITTLKVDGLGSGLLQAVLCDLRISILGRWIMDGVTSEVAFQMEKLYRTGLLGIRPSSRPWIVRLGDRVKVRFLIMENEYYEPLS